MDRANEAELLFEPASGHGEMPAVLVSRPQGKTVWRDWSGLRWLKARNSMGGVSTAGVVRLRAIKRSLCDRSTRRFAQDDDFVVSWRETEFFRKLFSRATND